MLVPHSGHKHADAPNAPRLLRLRGERPRGRRAAEQHDEFASPHWRSLRAEDRSLPCCQPTPLCLKANKRGDLSLSPLSADFVVKLVEPPEEQ